VTPELATLVRELRAAVRVPSERRLYDVEAIAEYSGYSPSTVQQRHTCLPGFPVPIRIEGGQPRWVAAEVWQWYEQQRGRLPKPRGN
jgi:predicted DNA-binding transcriptional regulator AlpA